MRTGRPKTPLSLTPEERRELESLAHRSGSVPALARRARIVLACATGADNKDVARRLRVTPATVGTWRTRFVEQRLASMTNPAPELRAASATSRSSRWSSALWKHSARR
ncbi:MAG TPA: helix-turn-helix domain-containing protein, partial [Terriglobales bacterium]|nr:helix-turn-helix domain-containing protein [Terriglobales bacterium]